MLNATNVSPWPHPIVTCCADEFSGKPTCSKCSLINLVCPGYARNIVFATDNRNGPAPHRRQLFTDRERQSMSEILTAEVASKTAYTLLAEIDAEWENSSIGRDELSEVHRGPFGAFSVRQDPFEQVDSPDVSAFIDAFVTRSEESDACDHFQQHLLTNDDSTWLNDTEEHELAEFLGRGNDTLTERRATQPANRVDVYGHLHVNSIVQRLGIHLTRVPLQGRAVISALPLELPSPDFMQEAPDLLRYYASTVIALLTPFKHGKTPWHVLFLPLAKSVLAGITIHEPQDDASLGAFYGTLSLSALHRYTETRNRKWSDQADLFKSLAQRHMDCVYSKAYDRPKTFKYKTTAMALLTMAQLSIFEGSRIQTERCLLEVENFIRLRGLIRPHKSRKVRLLHHCYAYMRIFHESLSLPSTPYNERTTVRHVVTTSEHLVLGQDDPSFRLTAWDNLDEKLREIKSRELGENDLHLANPGLWTSTLYPEIWGIPESWMILLSQTIRLGNEKDLAEESGTGLTLSLQEFLQRAKALEKCILQWESPTHSFVDAVDLDRQIHSSDMESVPLDNTLQALRHGLIIYFYRRIHDVDASLLQEHALQVRNSLFAHRQHARSSGTYLTGLVWPAFVAACEALDIDLQQSFLEWFDLYAQHNGQSFLTRTRMFVKTVWAQREKSRSASSTWLQLLRTNPIIL